MDQNRIILHIDMNSYFASVEQQANPFLRGKPVGVCAYLSPRGCIIASSTEAKKLGIKTGMRVVEARRIYPKVILVENEPAKYRSVTEKIFAILSDYSDLIEPYSIDEAFVDLTGWALRRLSLLRRSLLRRSNLRESGGWTSVTAAYDIALEIKQRITQEVGDWLKCSIGLAPTRWLAKFASDIADKNSILVLTKDRLEEIYRNHKLTDAWGIGPRLAIRLNRLGIKSLNDLKNYPPANLMQILGKPGYYLWANVNGVEIQGVRPVQNILPKSFGHSYCLPKKTTDLKYLCSILMKLCEKTGRRLRQHQLEARIISVGISYVSGAGRYRAAKTPDQLFDTLSIYRPAAKILFTAPLPDKVRMLAVSVTGLVPVSQQLSIFSDNLKKKRLTLALDKINNHFGEFTITPGEMLGTQGQAHDRIGFRKIEIND